MTRDDCETLASIVRVLEYLEWHGDNNTFTCRACFRFIFDGHTEDCPLGRTVRKATALRDKYPPTPEPPND